MVSAFAVSLYAAILGLLFVYLSLRTITIRRKSGVSLGQAENSLLLRAVRVHANFAEYVPFALLSILLVELLGTSAWLIHTLGCTLLLGRLLHAYGVSQEPENFRFRVIGMVLTFTVILSCSTFIIINSIL